VSAVVIDLNDVAPAHVQTARYDLDLIVQRLRETAESWVPRLFPNGKRVGDEWRLANIRGDAPRNTGSCVITLRGPHAGDWIDFDGNEGGGPISAIEASTGLSGRDLIIEAADIAGVQPGAPARQTPAAKLAPKRDAARDIAHILSLALPVAGTSAADYLVGRGLAIPADADLLFHSDLTHWETKTGYPALLGQVRDRSGEVIGLHRTYLSQGAGAVRKAPVAKPKMMLGRIAGGAVRLGPVGPDGRVGLCEGIETGLAVMTARPDLPVWATLSTSGLEQVELPPAAHAGSDPRRQRRLGRRLARRGCRRATTAGAGTRRRHRRAARGRPGLQRSPAERRPSGRGARDRRRGVGRRGRDGDADRAAPSAQLSGLG
jgi:putative DNA primase/helicase